MKAKKRKVRMQIMLPPDIKKELMKIADNRYTSASKVIEDAIAALIKESNNGV